MDIAHLYRITDQTSGKYYIGKHIGQVQNKYWGSGKKWKNYIKKHGTTNLKYEILAISDEDYILDLEGRYVTLDYIAQNPLCMNLKEGGLQAKLSPESIAQMAYKLRGRPSWNKGVAMSEETKLKVSLAKKGTPSYNKGKPMSDETKLKVSLAKKGCVGWNKGKSPSDETKAKISATLKGNTPWNKGKPASDKEKLRISQMRKGKPSPRKGVTLSEETKQKIRLSKIGKKQTLEHIEKSRLVKIGKKQSLVTCPHCNKVGGLATMPRWHFDNCKLKGLI